ncbi:uncharacterized protein LOC141906234 [Tubulanus polymorphus]|uniref:uncharacterized protein LOC141906234 n=1 Tax=Tubulanus polymorphus TaxID=672921 RepID=UPI003DA5FA07
MITVPKLELEGAVLGMKLAYTLKDELPELKFLRVFYWSDAVTVLRYINNSSTRFKTFVANRLSKILRHTSTEQWMYVPSNVNPADICTRGLPAAEIHTSSRWLRGPDFLYSANEVDEWPDQSIVHGPLIDRENIKKCTYASSVVNKNFDSVFDNVFQLVNIDRFSSWYELRCHVAWVIRAVKKFSSLVPRLNVDSGKGGRNLLPSELSEAQHFLIRHAQREGYGDEIRSLQSKGTLSRKSPIVPLRPTFGDGVLKVDGRLAKADIPLEARHQVILPFWHHVSRLIIAETHEALLHAGPEHVLAEVRQKFWPVKGRSLVRSVIQNCVICRRDRVKPLIPIMGNVPAARITAYTRPFTFTGVDYFGPIYVKLGRSTVKRWGCLFTCLVTRAIHLEVADSLETDSFILVLRNFIGRRGPPSEIYSDNGTNFVGAEKELRDGIQRFNQVQIHSFLLQRDVTWKFSPPLAPHFGGAWERLVKSTKKALKQILKLQLVTDSVLRTALIETEAVINSRPLTYNSSDPLDFSAITPNHFLHGGSTSYKPPDVFHDQEISSRKRWRQSQVIADHLWKRWLKEYLPMLTVRGKWAEDNCPINTGDLVLLVNTDVPRGQWSLARVAEVYPGDDGKIRVVKLKTGTGAEFIRPVAKIARLEEAIP